MPTKKSELTEEDELALWQKNILSLDNSQGLLRAAIFYIIKGFGICQGKDLRKLKTEQVKFEEDTSGSFVILDLLQLYPHRIVKRYDNPANPRSLYKILKKYVGFLANEGPLLVRPILSIKDYICYSHIPLGVTIMDQLVSTLMEELGKEPNNYGNVSLMLLAFEEQRSLGIGSHCINRFPLKYLLCSSYVNLQSFMYKQCTHANCEARSTEVCKLVSKRLDPPMSDEAEVRSEVAPTVKKTKKYFTRSTIKGSGKGNCVLKDKLKVKISHKSRNNAGGIEDSASSSLNNKTEGSNKDPACNCWEGVVVKEELEEYSSSMSENEMEHNKEQADGFKNDAVINEQGEASQSKKSETNVADDHTTYSSDGGVGVSVKEETHEAVQESVECNKFISSVKEEVLDPEYSCDLGHEETNINIQSEDCGNTVSRKKEFLGSENDKTLADSEGTDTCKKSKDCDIAVSIKEELLDLENVENPADDQIRCDDSVTKNNSVKSGGIKRKGEQDDGDYDSEPVVKRPCKMSEESKLTLISEETSCGNSVIGEEIQADHSLQQSEGEVETNVENEDKTAEDLPVCLTEEEEELADESQDRTNDAKSVNSISSEDNDSNDDVICIDSEDDSESSTQLGSLTAGQTRNGRYFQCSNTNTSSELKKKIPNRKCSSQIIETATDEFSEQIDSIQILRNLLVRAPVVEKAKGTKSLGLSKEKHQSETENKNSEDIIEKLSEVECYISNDEESLSPPQLSPQPLIREESMSPPILSNEDVDQGEEDTDMIKFLDVARAQFKNVLQSSSASSGKAASQSQGTQTKSAKSSQKAKDKYSKTPRHPKLSLTESQPPIIVDLTFNNITNSTKRHGHKDSKDSSSTPHANKTKKKSLPQNSETSSSKNKSQENKTSHLFPLVSSSSSHAGNTESSSSGSRSANSSKATSCPLLRSVLQGSGPSNFVNKYNTYSGSTSTECQEQSISEVMSSGKQLANNSSHFLELGLKRIGGSVQACSENTLKALRDLILSSNASGSCSLTAGVLDSSSSSLEIEKNSFPEPVKVILDSSSICLQDVSSNTPSLSLSSTLSSTLPLTTSPPSLISISLMTSDSVSNVPALSLLSTSSLPGQSSQSLPPKSSSSGPTLSASPPPAAASTLATASSSLPPTLSTASSLSNTVYSTSFSSAPSSSLPTSSSSSINAAMSLLSTSSTDKGTSNIDILPTILSTIPPPSSLISELLEAQPNTKKDITSKDSENLKVTEGTVSSKNTSENIIAESNLSEEKRSLCSEISKTEELDKDDSSENVSLVSPLPKNSGIYHYRSIHSEGVAYQDILVNKGDNKVATFSMADIPWCPPSSSTSSADIGQASAATSPDDNLNKSSKGSKACITSEVCVGDYLPEGAMIPAKGLRLVTQSGPSGMEVVLKFDFN